MANEHQHPVATDEAHGITEPAPFHRVPYYLIFTALVVLTAATFGVSWIRFQNEWMNVVFAVLMAFIKASLVALFFMHLKFEGKLIYMILIVPLVFCVAIIVSLIPDLVMTGPNSNSASMHLFNPPPVWHNK